LTRLIFAHIGRPSLRAIDAGCSVPFAEWGQPGHTYQLPVRPGSAGAHVRQAPPRTGQAVPEPDSRFAARREGKRRWMPELPDVESFRAVLAEHGTGCRVRHVEVADAGVLRDVGAGQLKRSLRGRRFGDPERHGKWLIAGTDGPTLLMHFGMTGALCWAEPGQERHRHDRVVFVLDGGELRFRDMRKLQGITLAGRPGDVGRVLAGLGPDALAIGRDDLGRALGSRRQAVKAALIDQSVIAGLGNLLADEILWRARIHPRKPARELGPAERSRVHGQMRRVLREAIPAGRVPARPGWLTACRDAAGQRCPRCAATLARGQVAGRSTLWCPRCQPC
jgi:formamidopyrimidine-DNA glycosylase